MKKNVKIIYYIIVMIIIVLGFVFGIRSEKEDGGYTVYDYSHKVKNEYTGGSSYPSKEIGDSHINKYIGWYKLYYVRDTDYYEGDLKIPRKTLEKVTSYRYNDSDFWFHDVQLPNIIVSIVIIIVLLIIPFIIDLILKGKKKASSDKQFKDVKKLKEKLDLGMISKEEFEHEKARILKK